MQDILSPEQIKQRCKALGLSLERLARLANVASSTAHRLGTIDNRISTRGKMTRALLQEEQRIRDHILALYPPAPGAQA